MRRGAGTTPAGLERVKATGKAAQEAQGGKPEAGLNRNQGEMRRVSAVNLRSRWVSPIWG